MDIHTFTALVGETPRQIRFLIAEGFVPPPTGGRAKAQYGAEHVEAVRRYRLLQADHSPAQIKLMMSAHSSKVRVPVVPGVELELDLALLGPSLDAAKAAARVQQILSGIASAADATAADATSSIKQGDPADAS